MQVLTSGVTLIYHFHLVRSGETLVRNKTLKWKFVILYFYFFYFLRVVTRPKYLHTDVGVARPGGSSPLDRREGARFVPQGDDMMGELEENLERLTLDIPDAWIDDLPLRYQRPTAGVPGHFSRLLRRVAQAIMCYNEHH